MATGSATITSDTLVGDALKRYPQSAAIFTRYGIDTCCGQGRPIGEGARVSGADAAKLLADLNALAD